LPLWNSRANLDAGLATLASRPQVLVSALAVGYYGDRGDEELDEVQRPVIGFRPVRKEYRSQIASTKTADAPPSPFRSRHVSIVMTVAS
jgi:NAD dependent epimerase/dehydratase family enzyme